jgi:hypothetical protein
MYPMTFAEFLLAGGHDQFFRIVREAPDKLDEFLCKAGRAKTAFYPDLLCGITKRPDL